LDEPTFDRFAVVPTKASLEPIAIRDSIKITIDRLNWLRSIAPSGSAQRKYDEPRNCLSGIQQVSRKSCAARNQCGGIHPQRATQLNRPFASYWRKKG